MIAVLGNSPESVSPPANARQPHPAVNIRAMKARLPRFVGTVILALAMPWLATVPRPAVAAPERSPRDATTEALLDALQERGDMADVMLWVLDRVAADSQTSEEFKRAVSFRRAAALVGTTRTESDSKKRTAILDEAEREIDNFLATEPEGRPAIDAYSQKANLLIQRGKAKLEQAKRPGQDAKTLRAESLPFFDAAVKSLQGTAKKGQPIDKITNAEDAVIKSLREVDAQIAEITKDRAPPKPAEGEGGFDEKPEKPDPKAKPKPQPPPPRLPPAVEKRLERLEEAQEGLRGKLLQTRLTVAEIYFEKARAYEPKSPEWKAMMEESTKRHSEIAAKYMNMGVGLHALYFEGRNYALLEERQKALSALALIYELETPTPHPMLTPLKARALAVALECWLLDKKYDLPDDPTLKFILDPRQRPKQLDADWLATLYRTAALLDARADALPDNEKSKKGILQRDAKKMATQVALTNKEFAKEARELAAKLGRNLPPEEQEEATFTSLSTDARGKADIMRASQLEAKQLQSDGKAEEAEAALATAAAARDEAIKAFEETLKLAADGKQDANAVSAIRSQLAFLLYDAKRFREAAELSTMLIEKFPDAMGSRQSGRIALASWQQLCKDEASAQEAKDRLRKLAEFMAAKWPTEPEGVDSVATLMVFALEKRNPEEIVAFVKKLPAESPKRVELLQRAGTALWREVGENRKLEESLRPDEAAIAGWKAEAKAALDEGLAGVTEPPVTKFAIAAALARAQIAIEDGELPLAGTVLENPVYGPWVVVQAEGGEFASGPLAEGGLTVALRYFIQTEQVEKAQQAMELLEKTAGDPAKLTSLYLSMGRDLQGQLEALSATANEPGVRERAAKVLTGFENFLQKLVARDKRVPSQMWVATTYMSLGSGKGTGAVVPAEKARGYLDRAADVYAGLLETGGEEIEKYAPSIRLRMAGIYRERRKWDEAQEQIVWFLSDPKRQNSLDTQVQAAELLQAAARDMVAQDPSKADNLFRESTVGRTVGTTKIWGWGGIASRLTRQVGSGGRADELYFESRLNISQCMLERSRIPGKSAEKKKELLGQAASAIAGTHKLYPTLGGEAMEKRFDALLKEIQKAQGAPPTGLQGLEKPAAAEPVTAAAAGS